MVVSGWKLVRKIELTLRQNGGQIFPMAALCVQDLHSVVRVDCYGGETEDEVEGEYRAAKKSLIAKNGHSPL